MSAPLERVVVVGSSCSGKTTFAVRLAGALGQTATDLDELHWAADWQEVPLDEFRRRTEQLAATDRWVVAGNYGDVRDVLWPRATTVVWLNYGFLTVLGRAVRRTIRRAITREPLWHGNRESFRRSFLSRDSILLWVLRTFHRRRREFEELRAGDAWSHLAWLEFRTPAEAERFVGSLGETPPRAAGA